MLNVESNTCLEGESGYLSDTENCVTCFQGDAEWECSISLVSIIVESLISILYALSLSFS